MSKKLSLAVLLSGNGTNFQAIVDSIENGYLKAYQNYFDGETPENIIVSK